jgi:hypothetical protein
VLGCRARSGLEPDSNPSAGVKLLPKFDDLDGREHSGSSERISIGEVDRRSTILNLENVQLSDSCVIVIGEKRSRRHYCRGPRIDEQPVLLERRSSGFA